jgi:hypothetical protein
MRKCELPLAMGLLPKSPTESPIAMGLFSFGIAFFFLYALVKSPILGYGAFSKKPLSMGLLSKSPIESPIAMGLYAPYQGGFIRGVILSFWSYCN